MVLSEFKYFVQWGKDHHPKPVFLWTLKTEITNTQNICYRKWGLAAHCSKANKEAKLAERKICFISDAGNKGGGGADSCPKATPPTDNQWAGAFFFFFF